MKVLKRVLEKRIRCQVSIDNMQFGFMLAKGTTDAIFIKRNTKPGRRICTMFFFDLENQFDRVSMEVVRWTLRKLDVDEWLICTIMALYTEARTV